MTHTPLPWGRLEVTAVLIYAAVPKMVVVVLMLITQALCMATALYIILYRAASY